MDSNLIVALISSAFTAVIGPIAVHVIKEIIDKKNKKDILKSSLQKNTLVNTKLEEIKEHLKADRVWVMQFHNGGTFYPTGKSIKKFSIFYEKLNEHAHSVKETFQNIPVSLFPKSLSKLYKDGELAIPSYFNAPKDSIDTYDLEVFHHEYNTKSFYAIAISDLNDHFIGVMGIAYTEKEHK